MTDYTELKRIAEAANAVTGDVSVDITISSERGPNQDEIDAVTAFVRAATPAAVLALIAENERLHLDNSSLRGSCARLGAENAAMSRNFKKANRMQFEVRTERDQLKAENEALRKRIDDMSPFKGAPLTGPDTKCLACGGYHYGMSGLPCPKMTPVAQALSMDNQRITPVQPLRVPHPLDAVMGEGEQS